jgi:hypothetical protein
MIAIRIFPHYSSFKEVVLKIDNIPLYFLQQPLFYVQHASFYSCLLLPYPLVFSLEAFFLLVFAPKNKPRRKTDCLFFSIQSTERTTLE